MILPDHHLHDLTWPSSSWSYLTIIFMILPDHHLHDLTWLSSSWSYLTIIFMILPDHHLHDLTWLSSSSWLLSSCGITRRLEEAALTVGWGRRWRNIPTAMMNISVDLQSFVNWKNHFWGFMSSFKAYSIYIDSIWCARNTGEKWNFSS